MRTNELLKQGETIILVLDSKDRQAFVIDCKRQAMPRWVDSDTLHDYTACPDEEFGRLPDINDLEPASRQFASRTKSDGAPLSRKQPKIKG